MNYQHMKIKLQRINKHYNSFNLRYQLLNLIHPINNATQKPTFTVVAVKVGFWVPTFTAVKGKSGFKNKNWRNRFYRRLPGRSGNSHKNNLSRYFEL